MTNGHDEVFDDSDLAPGDEHEGGVAQRILG